MLTFLLRPAPLAALRLRHRDSWGPCAHRWSFGPGDFAPDGLTSTTCFGASGWMGESTPDSAHGGSPESEAKKGGVAPASLPLFKI
ncbi:hypothetical protein [Leptospirillum ferriphilum]|uniref:hypothetical protein n=1 Tax=Leptospirillum ferriphilum TaxID=178606 RepID=UPI0012378FDE|nr:hypothetical protein [Leptospirillum ferriphilum]